MFSMQNFITFQIVSIDNIIQIRFVLRIWHHWLSIEYVVLHQIQFVSNQTHCFSNFINLTNHRQLSSSSIEFRWENLFWQLHLVIYLFTFIRLTYQSIWRFNQLSISSKSTLSILIIKSWRIDVTYFFRIRICFVDQVYQANSTKTRHHSNSHKFIFRFSKFFQINIFALFAELWKFFIIWKTISTSWLHFSIETLLFLFFNCKISLIR